MLCYIRCLICSNGKSTSEWQFESMDNSIYPFQPCTRTYSLKSLNTKWLTALIKNEVEWNYMKLYEIKWNYNHNDFKNSILEVDTVC